MKFSIVVPVYNAETSIEKCINSLLNQLFKDDFEVIAVDDASTDNSLSILNKLQSKDKRLRIAKHTTNKRQTVARSTGMKMAIGDYIMHVDADDWLLPNALETIYSKIIEYNPDVIVTDSYLVYGDDEKILSKYVNEEIFTKDKVLIQDSFYSHSGTKIVKRELTKNMITGKESIITNADDLLYCFEILLRAKSFYMLSSSFYVACINSESLTRSSKPFEKLNGHAAVLQPLRRIIEDNKAEKKIVLNLFKYLDKIFYEFVLLVWFSNSINLVNRENLLLANNNLYSIDERRLKSYRRSLNNRYFAYYYSLKPLGKKYALLIIIKRYAHMIIDKFN